MVARLVELEGVQVQLETVDVVFGSEGPPAPPGPPGFAVYRNGVLEPILWNNSQLSSISLSIAAYDGQIGMGSVTVPGTGWRAGDRLSFISDLGYILYTGFVMDWSRRWSDASPSELETTYQLMDLNRQLIGRSIVEWVRSTEDAYSRLSTFLIHKFSDLTLDLTYLDTWTGYFLPAKSYTGDGAMDLIADLILYTGKTVYMLPDPTIEELYQLHFHDLYPGPIWAGFGVSDVLGDIDLVDVFPMTDTSANYSASDLAYYVEGRNGTATVAGLNVQSQTTHGAGGLKFEKVASYAVTEQDLILLVNNLLSGTTGVGDEKPTYSFTIQHLTGTELIRVPCGSTIEIDSQVLGIQVPSARIAHETLTVSRDVKGNPLPGYWDLAIELGFPFRSPAAVRGYGGQGGSFGAIMEVFPIADHVEVTYSDLSAVPVGSSILVTGVLKSPEDEAVRNADVILTWSLQQWQDEAETIPSTAWSLTEATSLTDRFGVALNILSHDNAGTWTKVRPRADL